MTSNTRILPVLVAAFFAMAFTLPGCPDMDAINQKMADLEKKSNDTTKQVREIADQLRIMNDEHNTMKQLVSQVSTTVLEQKDALEKIDAALKARASAPTKAKPASTTKKRRTSN